ncbi:MAG TPA: cytochrome bd-I oxidase subunit CydX [Rickettsiales bacterium]|nr:cytochrome bd-I oxidase subunit CydX [Rickettsiales bacterium]
MWYFSWILGLGMAVLFGTLNAMWLEMHLERKSRLQKIDIEKKN